MICVQEHVHSSAPIYMTAISNVSYRMHPKRIHANVKIRRSIKLKRIHMLDLQSSLYVTRAAVSLMAVVCRYTNVVAT